MIFLFLTLVQSCAGQKFSEILAHSAFLARTEVGQERITGLGAVPF